MRSLVMAVVILAALAAPCLAQSLSIKDGSPVSIERLGIGATVDEGVALVGVDEVFRNATDAQREGVWKFRLPADAVVCSFSMWMNGQEKTGRVLEAQAARRVYDAIVSKKKDPGLLEQTGWRDFQVSVFPIPPRDTVRIRLRYAYLLPDELGIETLEVPLPVGCGAIGDLRVHATFAAARGLATLDCPSHADAKLVCDGGHGEASWSGDGVKPTGPLVLRALPKRDGFDVSVVAHRVGAPGEGGPAEGFFVARVVPRLASPPVIPRDVVFVLDRSGSMEGAKIEQARTALLRGLDTLKPDDRFDVVSFSSDVTSLGGGRLLAATPENVEAARRIARELSATGGTNIGGALDAALALRGADAKRLFAVVFLTDGDPTIGETQPDRIVAAWRAKSAGAARLFAFGVGADVKDFLLTKLAAEGRGAATYVRRDDELEVKLSSLVDSIRTPLLVDPEMSVEGEGVEVLDREPTRLPDVFQGRALVIAGRFRGAGKATLHLRGRSGADAVDVAVPVDFGAAADRPHVAQIWAKARIERLLDDLRAGGANAEIKAEIVRLALRHQVVTPYTSFLVVEDGVRIPDPGETARVPDEPGGQSTGGPDAGGPSTPGGGWTGSGGLSVPPDSREPSDPPPAPEGGGPSTPGPDTDGPSSGGGGGGASTGGGASAVRRKSAGYEDWRWWWQFNWPELVATSGVARRVVATPETLAALRTFARDENESFHVRSKALLALAAMGDVEIVPDLVRLVSAKSREAHRSVVEDATLALGLLDRLPPGSRELLLRTLRDHERDWCFARTFAAVALAMHRGTDDKNARAASAMIDVAEDTAERRVDLRQACAWSAGLLGRGDVSARLLRQLSDTWNSPFAVDALGRIGRPGVVDGPHGGHEVVDALLATLGRRVDRNVARSATTALARISSDATQEDRRRIVDALAAAVRSHDDVTVAGWSAVALGRIAADKSTDVAARALAVGALERALGEGKPPLVRAYAALGLGLACRATDVVPRKTSDEIRAKLREALAIVGEPRNRGAYALAVGLSGDAGAAPALSQIAADAGIPPTSRDAAVVALAMLHDAKNRVDVVAKLRGDEPSLLVVEAVAADGVATLAPALVSALQNNDLSTAHLADIAFALGRCGDTATVDALVAIARDPAKSHPDATRGWAVMAIGRLCGDFGPLDRVVEGVNFRAYVPAIVELMSLR